MNRIKRVSLFFRILFQIAFIVLPLTAAIAWINAPTPITALGKTINIDVIPNHYPILHPLSNKTKTFGFLITMVPISISLFVLYFLIQLFRLYEQGEIFSIKNVHYLRNVGYTLLIGQIIHPIHDALLSVTLTWGNRLYGQPPMAFISLNQTNIAILLTALLVILISWIIAEGYQLREEQQLTV